MAPRPYGDRSYRAMRRYIAGGDVGCVLRYPGCTGVATTVDHAPALVDHAHVAGSGCCVLRPACGHCNYGSGARVGNRRRRTWTRARLAPGSGRM